MDKERATELAGRQSLDISDWLEITDIPLGEHGHYLIGADGVRFRPNKDSADAGWSAEQIAEALPSYWRDPDESKASAQRQALTDNGSLLLFPCTPLQLVELVLKDDASGDLHGSLPGSFIAAVYECGSLQQSCPGELEDLRRQLELERAARQDAEQRAKLAKDDAKPSRLLAIAGLLELLLDDDRPKYLQGTAACAIEAAHPDWLGSSASTLGHLFSDAKKAAKEADKVAQAKADDRQLAVEAKQARAKRAEDRKAVKT